MEQSDLERIFNDFYALPAETEWLEFKEAKDGYHFDKIAKYFSALSNEANLKNKEHGWLVFGVKDNPRDIKGTNFRPDRASLDSLKHEIAKNTSNGLTFVEIHEITIQGHRIIMFQIPPALKGMPTSWKGHFYGRDGESLVALNPAESEQFRLQTNQEDWSAKICKEAKLEHLDSDAILFARDQYKSKHPKKAEECDEWDDITFLNKAKICINGEITNTTLLLLGKEESEHLLLPSIAQITWVLRDEQNIDIDYSHFHPPLILAVGHVYDKVRNLTYRYLPNQSLFPTEITQYDNWVFRETLHNCIAHQDWTKSAKINVVEKPESILFTNVGHFIPGSVEEVILRDAPPDQYRNPFLANAMVNLNMIDTIGSGIKRMFRLQRERYFPMPDYDLSDPERVQVRLTGKVLDENYTRLLMESTDLDLMDVIALDKVQKGKSLNEDEHKSLRSKKLVEGRRPNLIISADIAAITGSKADYIKQRGFDADHYKTMILSYLEKFYEASRAELDELLIDKIPDALDQEQKRSRIKNLLQ